MTNRAKLTCLYVNKYKMISHPTSSLHHAKQSLPYMSRHRYILTTKVKLNLFFYLFNMIRVDICIYTNNWRKYLEVIHIFVTLQWLWRRIQHESNSSSFLNCTPCTIRKHQPSMKLQLNRLFI